MPRSLQCSLSLRFPHQDPIHPPLLPIRATCPTHLILLDFITRTILGEEYKSFSSSLINLLHSLVSSSLLGPNILLNTIFSNTLSFLSSRSYPLYRRPFLYPQPEDEPCGGERFPLHGNIRHPILKLH